MNTSLFLYLLIALIIAVGIPLFTENPIQSHFLGKDNPRVTSAVIILIFLLVGMTTAPTHPY